MSAKDPLFLLKSRMSRSRLAMASASGSPASSPQHSQHSSPSSQTDPNNGSSGGGGGETMATKDNMGLFINSGSSSSNLLAGGGSPHQINVSPLPNPSFSPASRQVDSSRAAAIPGAVLSPSSQAYSLYQSATPSANPLVLQPTFLSPQNRLPHPSAGYAPTAPLPILSSNTVSSDAIPMPVASPVNTDHQLFLSTVPPPSSPSRTLGLSSPTASASMQPPISPPRHLQPLQPLRVLSRNRDKLPPISTAPLRTSPRAEASAMDSPSASSPAAANTLINPPFSTTVASSSSTSHTHNILAPHTVPASPAAISVPSIPTPTAASSRIAPFITSTVSEASTLSSSVASPPSSLPSTSPVVAVNSSAHLATVSTGSLSITAAPTLPSPSSAAITNASHSASPPSLDLSLEVPAESSIRKPLSPIGLKSLSSWQHNRNPSATLQPLAAVSRPQLATISSSSNPVSSAALTTPASISSPPIAAFTANSAPVPILNAVLASPPSAALFSPPSPSSRPSLPPLQNISPPPTDHPQQQQQQQLLPQLLPLPLSDRSAVQLPSAPAVTLQAPLSPVRRPPSPRSTNTRPLLPHQAPSKDPDDTSDDEEEEEEEVSQAREMSSSTVYQAFKSSSSSLKPVEPASRSASLASVPLQPLTASVPSESASDSRFTFRRDTPSRSDLLPSEPDSPWSGSIDVSPFDVSRVNHRVRLFVGTWNLHAKPPPSDLEDFIPAGSHDIYVIGTEECENSIEMSFLFSSKDKWVKSLTQHLGEGYEIIGQETLQAIHIIAFARTELLQHIHGVETDKVPTGMGDVLGNKGGVALCFDVGPTSFLFVNAHFAAHQDSVEKRNADFHKINSKVKLRRPASALTPPSRSGRSSPFLARLNRTSTGSGSNSPNSPRSPSPSSPNQQNTTQHKRAISNQSGGAGTPAAGGGALSIPSLAGAIGQSGTVAQELRLQAPHPPLSPSSRDKSGSATSTCSDRFDRVFWLGDFNYRVNGTRRMIEALLEQGMVEVMKGNDQLAIEMKKGNVFAGFREGPINFAPTYKFDKDSDVFDSSVKQRVPSWTDRILWKSNPVHDTVLRRYDSVPTMRTSDHRPVFATFYVNAFAPSASASIAQSPGHPTAPLMAAASATATLSSFSGRDRVLSAADAKLSTASYTPTMLGKSAPEMAAALPAVGASDGIGGGDKAASCSSATSSARSQISADAPIKVASAFTGKDYEDNNDGRKSSRARNAQQNKSLPAEARSPSDVTATTAATTIPHTPSTTAAGATGPTVNATASSSLRSHAESTVCNVQ